MSKAKKSSSGSVVGLIIAIVLFAFLTIFVLAINATYLFGKPQNFYSVVKGGEPKKGEWVTLEVDGVVDWYAETEYKINGVIPAGKEQHCIVWLDDDAFISLTVKGDKDISKIDDIIDSTYAYLDDPTTPLSKGVKFVGKVSTVGSEVSQYYDEALSAYGISGDPDFKVYYLTIDASDTKLSIWMQAGVCALIDIICVFSLISIVKNKKKEKEALAMQASMPVYTEDNNFPYQQ